MSGESGKLFSFHNVGLFSDHFLSKRLPAESPLWASEKAAARTTFDQILANYKKFHSTYKHPNEAQTEDGFIRPVLNTLGYFYIPQTSIKDKGVPDYSLFVDEKTKKEAGSLKVKEQEAFYSKAVAICDAKYWGRPLDIKIPGDKRDTFKNANPSFQIVNYLVGANVDWGILTNGKLWRLYYQKASSRSSNFYEIDLEDLLLKGDPEKFLYFYLFFRKEAFLKDSQGKSFLDNVLEGSTHYATELSDRLKEKVFEEIFPHLARGFLHYRKAEQGIKEETKETLKDIYNGTLTLLYRLLFILYAEDRDLLPVNGPGYFHYSLANMKQKVAGLRDKKATLSELSTDLWSDLDTLFKIIDLGDPKLNVPTYNGGLFSHKNPKNDFLKANRVPDPWLAEAIDHLAREHDKDSAKRQSIDYSELEVRHLGSIYEGLLEFHLKIADEDKALAKEKGREIYKSVADVKNPKEIVQKGEFYLENDRHERKSTGSYYTPDYIVKYIVQNAVGPVLEEKLKKVERLFTEIGLLSAKAKKATISRAAQADHLKAKKRQASDELFSLKVLDPAMGSGHFLVETVDFLSDHIIKFLNHHPENPVLEEIESLRSTILSDLKKKGIHIDEQKLTPTNLVRRMVMKRCIYGVDLNPMAVELAKLSLWLHSFTLGAPLSFLDHHLKCGNSLIGTTVETVKGGMEEVKVGEEGRYVDWEGREKVVPEQKAMYLFGSQFAGLLSATELMRQVGELTDSTFEEVQESQEKYETAADALKPFKLILDLWNSEHFGNKDAQRFLTHGGDVEAFLKGNSRLPKKMSELRQETERISQNKRFFHWELEFPEVFYEGAREKENPGFDAVIGNPPYGNIGDASYLRAKYPTTQQNSDVYVAFIERALAAARRGGWSSYIVPVTWQTGVSYADLRNRLLENTRIDKLVNLPFDVFPEAYVDTCIAVFHNIADSGKSNARVYAFPKKTKVGDLASVSYKVVRQADWLEGRRTIIADPVQLSLLRRLADDRSTQTLESITDSARGILAAPQDIANNPSDSSWKRFFDGEMDRYVVDEPRRFVRYGDNLRELPSSFDFFQGQRLLIRRLVNRQDRLMATVAAQPFVNKKDIYNFKVNSPNYSTLFLLSLANSRLFSFVYLQQDVAATKDDFRQTTLDGLRALPIRRIGFKTPPKDRTRLLEKAGTLYGGCLQKNDLLCVTGFVGHCLKQKAEQADVVHDLLAFLAERMIEMNKEKQAETRGFLEWLEANIGAKVDTLKNKTKITAYHQGTLEDLLEILKENRKALKINAASKDFFDPLKVAFEKSLAKLSPLKTKLVTTDRLIDLIVYQLYGLTEEEIKGVEGDQNKT